MHMTVGSPRLVQGGTRWVRLQTPEKLRKTWRNWFNSSSLQLKSSNPIFTNSLVSFFNSKFYVDFSFFRFWSPQVWGLIRCTTHWSIGCIPWKTSLENQAVIFSSTGKLSEFFRFNFNLFLWPPFDTFAFFMMIFYLDSVWVLQWVYMCQLI